MKTKTPTNREKRIIRVLRENGRCPASKISLLSGIHYYIIRGILKDMQSSGFIEMHKKDGKDEWSLKEGE